MQIVLQTHFIDEPELLFDEVDVLFFAFLNVHQQIARHVILDGFAVCDGRGVHRMRLHFALQIAQQYLAHVLADEQLAQVLQIRQTLEKKNALDQAIGVPHLIDGFVVFDLAEALQAPVIEHARMQEILIDRGQLVLQRLVEKIQYLRITLHGGSSWKALGEVEDCMLEQPAPSEREFGDGAGEAVRSARLVLSQGIGQRSPGLRQTFPAAGSQAEIPAQIGHLPGSVLDGGPDMLFGDGFAYADDHA